MQILKDQVPLKILLMQVPLKILCWICNYKQVPLVVYIGYIFKGTPIIIF